MSENANTDAEDDATSSVTNPGDSPSGEESSGNEEEDTSASDSESQFGNAYSEDFASEDVDWSSFFETSASQHGQHHTHSDDSTPPSIADSSDSSSDDAESNDVTRQAM